jgi:hypothetical protein
MQTPRIPLSPQWWSVYASPLSTWETLEGYHLALGLLRSKPPSQDLEKERIQGYLAGLLEGEGYFYYTRYARSWYPSIYLKMCEKKPVEFFCDVMNVKILSVQRAYRASVKGLRTILLARIIRPMLTGRRGRVAHLFETRGYRVTNSRTFDDYVYMYRIDRERTDAEPLQ